MGSVLCQNLQGLPGVYRIADDLLFTGKGDTKKEVDGDHDANLVCLLQFNSIQFNLFPLDVVT